MKTFLQKLSILSITPLILLAITWSATAHRPLLAQEQPPAQPTRTLSVSGNGMVSVRPDVAVVTVGVQTEDADAGNALDQNNQQMQALIDALQASGVISDDIQTQTVQLQPQLPVPSPDQPIPLEPGTGQGIGASDLMTPSGYIASNLVEVRVRDLTSLGDLLNSVVEAGANRIQGIRFEVSDPAAAIDQARQQAWENARSSAEKLAQLAGVSLGAVMQISEFSSAPTAPLPTADTLAAKAGVPISPGMQQVTVNLQVIWQLGE